MGRNVIHVGRDLSYRVMGRNIIYVGRDLDATVTKGQRERLAKEHGIKGEPSLCRVNSINYANCTPWEWMHLFLKNIIPQLVDLWIGCYKMLDTSVKLKITAQEINDLEQWFAEWVREFERYYYQFKEDRLAVCTLLIHGCLHVAKDLHMCGPAWVHWTFYVEQYCLHLRTGLRSRRHPWSGLSRVVLYTAYLSQLSVKIIGGGDSIRTRYALRGMSNAKYHDNSFVRVKSQSVDVIGYGQLDKILICEIGEHKIYRFLCNTTLILTLITPCNTDGTDASISLVGYKEFVTPVFTDVRNIKAVVGRGKSHLIPPSPSKMTSQTASTSLSTQNT
ncbi:uncharacterized protein F5891DRAFT_1131005 [Suillus fuscotomentosus]|uniref:Uncharacterized protein n=1 Tax=Suillus fuscotomentosus TaxID=1912939 RepID=A0AAD4HFH3_9AGAM|nr:uncharacterized protein F5891DRAFT_1131005 [Suillus fuscotomentosus]KAG1894281.1 hypothetical protein F5891DRAFT_1131005 [Suillus fuscotomentosus]